jgi:hypothetical protein
MRTKRRVGLVLASAAAFGVGLIAFPGSAGAAVPNCTVPATTGNDSCAKVQVSPSTQPDTFANAKALFRVRTVYTSPGDCNAGGCSHTVQLDFDNDFKINPGTLPTCSVTKADGNNQDIASVWADCGPAAGTSANAYISTQVAPTGFGCAANPCASGQASTVPPLNIQACVLAFNGPKNLNNQPTITLYARAPVTTAECAASPATNTAGSTNAVLKGTLVTSPTAGFGKRLTVTNIEQAPLALDDFFAYVKRGSYFQARCPAGVSPWKLKATWTYSGTGQATDTNTSTQACT